LTHKEKPENLPGRRRPEEGKREGETLHSHSKLIGKKRGKKDESTQKARRRFMQGGKRGKKEVPNTTIHSPVMRP